MQGIFGLKEKERAKEKDLKALEDALAYKEKLLAITNQIHAAKSIDDIFLRIQADILELFDADRITIYAVDPEKNELFSKYKVGDETGEIRVSIDKKSISGYVACAKNFVNIVDSYNDSELKNIDFELSFNQQYDFKTGYRTKQVLAAAILFQGELQGVIQLINKKTGERFGSSEISSIQEIAKILGIAFHNQKKLQKKLSTKFDYLIQKNIITEEELNNIIVKARKDKGGIIGILTKEYNVNKKDILDSLSNFYKCPFIEYDPKYVIDKTLLTGLSPSYLVKQLWIPFRKNNEKIEVLLDDPNNIHKIDEIKRYLNCSDLLIIGALPEDILKYLNVTIHSSNKDSIKMDDLLTELDIETHDEESEEEYEINETDNTIIKLANQIIRDAYNMGSSDIHIEPYHGKQPTIVRYRTDGECKKVLEVPSNYRRALASRLKIMSRLNIAERRLPQSGKIKFRYNQKDIELRVEVTPTVGGNEDLVLRILASGEPLPLEKMNLSDYNLKNFLGIISQPYGLILVVGPTGSGKTTMLHSALGHINKPDRKIWTAEDPVEITQFGLRQVQVNSQIGLTFANCMRSFLRADPDVIMVGEMRDKETASIGIEASLTGHLVFSTLHTNSAPETIVRLMDMGMDRFNFANALLGILAQRLLKTLCKDCKEKYQPSREEYDSIVHEYGDELFHKKIGIQYSDKLTFYRPKGCPNCENSGYKGRMGIHELLVGTDDIKRMIIEGSDINLIRDRSIENGMSTLKQDGITKVFKGYTDMLQVRKVCIK
ncbi:GspE/PulE family protein [bacterium]|nr:GspE/PulE family protein [bacterium]